MTAEMRVTEALKGVCVGTIVRIDALGSCGILFRPGKTYLVQIDYRCSETRQHDRDDDPFNANYCSYTHGMSDPVEQRLKLGKILRPGEDLLSGRAERCFIAQLQSAVAKPKV